MLAISDDDPAASVTFARQLGIEFPLLSDRDGAIARQYVGQDDHGNAVPGVVLVDRDGTIAFRQIGERKDDRLGAAALLATIDRTFGTSPGAGDDIAEPYLPVHRLQLRAEVGGGTIGGRGTATVGGAALIPLGAYALAGPALRLEARGAADLDGALVLRAPVAGRIAWAEVGGTAGYTVATGRGWNVGASADLLFAFDPGWAVQLGVTATWRDAGDHSPQLAATIGITRLLQMR
jgi:hypothetical protein